MIDIDRLFLVHNKSILDRFIHYSLFDEIIRRKIVYY